MSINFLHLEVHLYLCTYQQIASFHPNTLVEMPVEHKDDDDKLQYIMIA